MNARGTSSELKTPAHTHPAASALNRAMHENGLGAHHTISSKLGIIDTGNDRTLMLSTVNVPRKKYWAFDASGCVQMETTQ
ncbi:hypothetical protein D3C72_2440600 [compost metagenome]